MAKAVLIMDEMPECCADCSCGYFERGAKKLNLICGATGEDANNVGKPDWCPLVELPEEKESDPVMDCDIDFGIAEGWNMFRDELEQLSEKRRSQ